VIGALALLAGILLGLFSAALPGSMWLWVAGLTVALTFGARVRKRAVLRQLGCLLAGFVIASVSTHQWLSLCVPANDGRVLIEGTIRGVPAREGAEWRFDLDARIVEGEPRDSSLRHARVVWRNTPVAPRAGERWRLLVRLASPADAYNFAGPDTARFAFRDGVHLTGRVLPSALNARLELADSSVDTLRARIALRIGEGVADPDAAALLTALAVGLTDRMSTDQWRVFNATGTTHLVAISGLHVTMFALVAFMVARFAWRWLRLARRVEREPFALLLGLAAAGAYALLSGFSVPAQRTWLMLGLFALARLAARQVGVGRFWSLALMAVLLLDPLAPLAAGFWLSFVAVGVILMAGSEATGSRNVDSMALTGLLRGAGAAQLQCAILLALAPLTFAVFGGLSLAGLAVNLVAIPLVSFVLVPLVLAGALAVIIAPAASLFFFDVAARLYETFWPALTWAADREFALWHSTPETWWFPFAMVSTLVMLRRWPAPLRWSAACAVLPLVFAPSRLPEPGNLRVSVLDVGRGTAALIVTQSHVVLFDTGDGWNTRGARIHQWVLPALDALGRDRIDLLVLPALDGDRAYGAAALAFERDVSAILVGGGWPASDLPVSRCTDSDFLWDGVRFQAFAAGSGGAYCALRVSAGEQAILLGGDLPAAAERGLVARLPPGSLESTVVLVNRQTSALASSREWIDASAAELAIATGGIADSHSRAVTLERWRASGAKVIDTRRAGGVEIGFGTSGLRVLSLARVSRYPYVWRRLQ
jgi:competence protein ComEC